MAKLIRICSVWLVVNAIFLALAFPLAAGAESASSNCVLFQLQQHPAQKFIESSGQQILRRIRDGLCEFIEGRGGGKAVELAKFRKRSTRREFAGQQWNAQVAFSGYCGPKFSDELRENTVPQPVQLVFHKFCGDYFKTHQVVNSDLMRDSERGVVVTGDIERLRPLAEHYLWFRNELFCQVTGLVASPGGWTGVLEPDLPVLNRLERLSESLCDDVRKGAITVDEAKYRWDQELLRVKRRLGPETAREAIGYLSGILSDILLSLVK